MENFTPIASTIGGLMVGVAAAMLLRLNGRIAGISGILGSLVPPWPAMHGGRDEYVWRILFLAGLIVGAGVVDRWTGGTGAVVDAALPVVVVGGVLTGIGTRIGGGCTSGHSVCGLARVSARSITATAVYFAVTALTVFVMRHLVAS